MSFLLYFTLCMSTYFGDTSTTYVKILILKGDINNSYAESISKAIITSSKNNNIEINTVLSIIKSESNFNSWARGTRNEIGLMQIMPFWGKDKLCYGFSLWKTEDNIECGCRILKYYIDLFNNEILGITAYNHGAASIGKMVILNKNIYKDPYTKTILKWKLFLNNIDIVTNSLYEDELHKVLIDSGSDSD